MLYFFTNFRTFLFIQYKKNFINQNRRDKLELYKFFLKNGSSYLRTYYFNAHAQIKGLKLNWFSLNYVYFLGFYQMNKNLNHVQDVIHLKYFVLPLNSNAHVLAKAHKT